MEINYKNEIFFKSSIILITLLFGLTYSLYYNSLEGCYKGEDVSGARSYWIFIKIVQLSVSCIISSILFLLIYLGVISKLHIFHFSLIFIFFYEISHGFSFEDHGGFNLIGFFIVFFLIFISGIIIKIFISLIIFNSRKPKLKKISTIIILFFFYLNPIANSMNCSDWGKGLNNTFIEDDKNKYKCKIYFPKKCPYNIFKYFLDFNKLFRINCSKPSRNYRKIILKNSKSKYINEHTQRFGFPLTNKGLIGRLDGKGDYLLKSFVLNNLFDIDKEKEKIDKTELILDFSKTELGEYFIDLKYNESLSKERKKLEKNVLPYSNNILVFFIDSVSRANSIRQLKKTLSFFEKFMSYNGGYNYKFPDEKFHSFQFFKYHSFKNLTHGNYLRLFYGSTRFVKKLVSMAKYFKENGYITNYNSDFCQKDYSRTHHNLEQSDVYDHQFLLCDPNIVSFLSSFKKCLYGKTNVEHLCNYAEQFWRKYSQNRKFSATFICDGHEGSLESIKYIDEYIYNYLNNLFNDGLLKDTSVILLSDHGTAMPSIYVLYDFFHKETGLPMLYLLINDRKNVSYNEQYYFIHENQQNFITAYDIYNSIYHLLYGDHYVNIKNKSNDKDSPKSKLGQSLFTYISKKPRKSLNLKHFQNIICK